MARGAGRQGMRLLSLWTTLYMRRKGNDDSTGQAAERQRGRRDYGIGPVFDLSANDGG